MPVTGGYSIIRIESLNGHGLKPPAVALNVLHQGLIYCYGYYMAIVFWALNNPDQKAVNY
jgi:hypothetical protein